MPCVYVSKLVNRCPMVAGFPREAIEFGRGSGKMSVGWRLLLLAVLSRYRGWLPAPKGTVILAPLTLLWRGVVLPSLETVVAAAITVGIALTSKPSQLSQQIAYSPARGLAPVPGGGISSTIELSSTYLSLPADLERGPLVTANACLELLEAVRALVDESAVDHAQHASN
jgi:hypothetical protein